MNPLKRGFFVILSFFFFQNNNERAACEFVLWHNIRLQ
ncbi:hypothetical protein HPHPH11_0453 [Helicobacter pylori Hp H-11]|nr:hypothetical protein HPHPH11_0453 [Helicobacter pylori Hp H-11]